LIVVYFKSLEPSHYKFKIFMLFCREPMGVVRFGPALAGSAWP